MSIASHDIYSKGDQINAYKTKASIFVAFINNVKDKERDFNEYFLAGRFFKQTVLIIAIHPFIKKLFSFLVKLGIVDSTFMHFDRI